MVIEWHVVAMYARLRDRIFDRASAAADHPGRRRLTVIAVVVALDGISVAHFVAALALVGLGWNFMYTGGTTLLTETYAPNEKARTQGLNDFIVFATMGVSSLASGALVTTSGWQTMNRAALPILAAIAAAVLWLMWVRRPARVASA
jgi:MFS family permease